jgi:hypothetical protein
LKTIHIYSQFDPQNNEDKRRFSYATQTWAKNLYDYGIKNCGIPDNELFRTSKSQLDDTRTLPFVKDLIKIGIEKENPDIIIFTNADTCIYSGALGIISDGLNYNQALAGKRIDYDFKLEYEPEISKGKEERFGFDILVMTIDWIKKYLDYYPDMLLGAHKWDIVFSDLILITNPKAEIKNCCYHEQHERYWLQAENKNSVSQVYNAEISDGVYEKYRILRHLSGLCRGQYDNVAEASGSINHELKSVYNLGKNWLTLFCNKL